MHYEASKEVGSKGVRFCGFSKDGERRKRESKALREDRGEIERGAKERRRIIAPKRGEEVSGGGFGGVGYAVISREFFGGN